MKIIEVYIDTSNQNLVQNNVLAIWLPDGVIVNLFIFLSQTGLRIPIFSNRFKYLIMVALFTSLKSSEEIGRYELAALPIIFLLMLPHIRFLISKIRSLSSIEDDSKRSLANSEIIK